MLTVLCEIEQIVNNRPLTYVYEDLAEEPLTPYHLLYGRRLNSVVSLSNNLRGVANNRKEHVKQVINHFWNRWRNEYILELREHYKKKSRNHNKDLNINIGDIILVVDEKQPRSCWRLGRVIEIIHRRDNLVRGAVVRIQTEQGRMSHLRRPINKLVPVELCEDAIEDDVNIRFI